MNNQTEREAFEAAYKKLHPQVTIRQQNLIGTYTDQYVDQAAFWFQAGAAYQREQNKVLVEALLDQLANGTHLDDVPNHDDDSLNELARMHNDKRLMRHAERVQKFLATYKAQEGE